MFFFGAEFTVEKTNILNVESSAISKWGDRHGFEAIFNFKNLVMGAMVLFLARVQASLYFINNIDDKDIYEQQKRMLCYNTIVVVLFFLVFATL